MKLRAISGIICIALLVLLPMGLVLTNSTIFKWFACKTISQAIFSIGVFSNGVFSGGVFSCGIFSIGLFSLGIFSFGFFSIGTFAAGIWVAGQLSTKPLLPSAWELKMKLKKYASPELEQQIFKNPLKSALGSSPDARMLDLACGTGRMSLMVLKESWFQGRIKAIDLSQGMLKRFKAALQEFEDERQNRVSIHRQNLVRWRPEANEGYEAVTLVEASEMLPNFVELVNGISQIIKPGGLFLLTKPPNWMTWVFPGRKLNKRELLALLKNKGFHKVEIAPWTFRYEVVRAWKATCLKGLSES